MARHINQRALTVNTKRENTHPQARRVQNKVATPCSKRDEDFVEFDDYEAPLFAGANLHLLLTGQHRAGAYH